MMTLSMITEELPFSTRWNISKGEKGKIESFQEIKVSGLADVMQNQFSFYYDLTKKTLAIELNNQSLGKVAGRGMVNDQLIGWEFRLGHLGFEGFEFYEKGKNAESYLMHAEYATNDDFRTVIHGKIWYSKENASK